MSDIPRRAGSQDRLEPRHLLLLNMALYSALVVLGPGRLSSRDSDLVLSGFTLQGVRRLLEHRCRCRCPTVWGYEQNSRTQRPWAGFPAQVSVLSEGMIAALRQGK